jgi:feruloyl esterase
MEEPLVRTLGILQQSTKLIVIVITLGCIASASTDSLPACSAAGIQAVAPAGMKITPITDGQTPPGITQQQVNAGGGVVLVPANSKLGTPQFCFVQGNVVTNPSTGKTANFQAALPTRWNGKFLVKGCGGLCGAAGLPETVESLQHGYSSVSTDDGHIGNPKLGGAFDASWALNANGTPNTDAVTDFYFRAVHTVTQAGKELAQGVYSQSVNRSYFTGCSDGGREGMVEVTQYPTDFDGVIAGDPFFDVGGETIGGYTVPKVQLRANDAPVIPSSLLHILDTAIHNQCDAADGVTDGLIQDPALCNYNPQTTLPICSPGHTTNCFTHDQADSIASWFTAITDPSGVVTYPGYALADVDDLPGGNLAEWAIPTNDGPPKNINAPQPWGSDTNSPPSWLFADNVLRYLVFQNANFNSNSGLGMTFNVGNNQIQNILPDATAQRINQETAAGSGDDPQNALNFLSQGKKLIMYHGYSDGDISPYRTFMYYEALAKAVGGYSTLQNDARLFMVPGMFHCEGGPGPNVFDTLSALEGWVEKGIAPDALLATGGAQHDQHGNPRSMPLCKFPEMASYNGKGDVNDAVNWSCPPNDQRLLNIGPNGVRAGLR